jgi:hypothetical protein
MEIEKLMEESSCFKNKSRLVITMMKKNKTLNKKIKIKITLMAKLESIKQLTLELQET